MFQKQAMMVRAFYYTALLDDQEYSPIRPLVDWLDYNGYTIVTKPTKEFTDATGRRKIKGNMDIELAIDVMEMSDRLDHIVLFSGDGDFRRLVEAVQRKGVRVTVISTIKSSPPMIADEAAPASRQLCRAHGNSGIHLPSRIPAQHAPADRWHGSRQRDGPDHRRRLKPRAHTARRHRQKKPRRTTARGFFFGHKHSDLDRR